ncbi:MAG: phytanoyl-CoA dioxygenase family protein [Phycisphaerae bacterium]
MPTTTTLPRLMSSEHELDVSADKFGPLRDSSGDLGNLELLRQRMEEEGYLFLPGLLNRDDVLAARGIICQRLLEQQLLDPASDPLDGVARKGAAISAFQPELFTADNPPLHRVLYRGALMECFTGLLGGPVRHFDFTWFRSIPHGRGTASHCDVVYMGRGTPRLYTAWTPVGDVSYELGGLMILEGSHRHQRLRDTYCTLDVDAHCTNKSGPAGLDAWAKGTNGALSTDPNRIRNSLGGRWLTSEYRAGDVLLFSIFTVHASLDNQTDRIRLSSDSRYQLASEPADERWIGEKPIGHGPEAKKGLIC